MSNHGNSTGPSREAKTLDYYDRLPPIIRAALRDARFDWATRYFLKQWNKGNMSPNEIVKYIKEIDRKQAIKEAPKVWGENYPAQ